MTSWLRSWLRPVHAALGTKKIIQKATRYQPTLELLEDRSVPSTMSSIASNFNGTAIPAGDSIWFNAAFKAGGLGTGAVTVHVTDQVISFSAGGTAYNLSVPDSAINFSAANTVASTSFNAGNNTWVTNLPMTWSGNAFLGGATFVAPAGGLPAGGLPGGINPVTWSGNFSTDTAGVAVKWQWGAAVYTSFSSDYSALNVKPLDSNSATAYHNSDHAGTPEAFKSFVIGGARGGGGSNWTGSYSSTKTVFPTVDDSTPQPAAISGFAADNNGTPLEGVMITLTDSSGATFHAMTDANGFYRFDNVAAGAGLSLSDQAVTILGITYNPKSATAGTVDGGQDGSGDGADTITNITLDGGDVGINYDFVLAPPRGGV